MLISCIYWDYFYNQLEFLLCIFSSFTMFGSIDELWMKKWMQRTVWHCWCLDLCFCLENVGKKEKGEGERRKRVTFGLFTDLPLYRIFLWVWEMRDKSFGKIDVQRRKLWTEKQFWRTCNWCIIDNPLKAKWVSSVKHMAKPPPSKSSSRKHVHQPRSPARASAHVGVNAPGTASALKIIFQNLIQILRFKKYFLELIFKNYFLEFYKYFSKINFKNYFLKRKIYVLIIQNIKFMFWNFYNLFPKNTLSLFEIKYQRIFLLFPELMVCSKFFCLKNG